MKPLSERRSLVTGATSGIGRAITLRLAESGASVVATGRDDEALRQLQAEEPAITGVPADLTSGEAQERVLSVCGDLDVLVCDAGVGWVGLFEDMPLAEVERVVSVNLLATVLLVRRALPRMRPGGHLVLLGSVLGWLAGPPLTVYSSTKFAVHGFSRGLRRELGGRGLHVTEVAPGPVATSFFPRATSRPRAGSAPDFPMLDPDRVASAVHRALLHPSRPFTRTVAVPRVAGLARVAEFPGVELLTDLVGTVGRTPLLLRHRGAGPGEAAS